MNSLLHPRFNHLDCDDVAAKGLLLAVVFAFFGQTGLAAVLYVDSNSSSPAAPYSSWAAAAQAIQEAIDAATAGDLILVTNGVYQTGGGVAYGAMTNRVALTKPLTVQSVNGPLVTVIKGNQVPGDGFGDGAVRCAYLTNGAVLTGFALTNGATLGWQGDYPRETTGGGVYCESTSSVVSDCILAGNVSVYDGGASYGGTLSNCTLVGNMAPYYGGGAMSGVLNNCVLVSNRVTFLGFGGSAYGSILNNCELTANSATYKGGGAYQSTLNGCTLRNDSAPYGGGAVACTLSNCVVENNWASSGGGAAECSLFNCALTGNSATTGGGASEECSLVNCTLTGNTAPSGAGAYRSSLVSCSLRGNAASYGAGALACTLANCALCGNSASFYGGGAYYSSLNNCTLTANSASSGGGGASDSLLNNCIVYYNAGGNYSSIYSPTELNYCCTTPLPTNGLNNIIAEPELVDPVHLKVGSPCIGAGSTNYGTGTDIDGEAWGSPPSIGCDEFYPGQDPGPLSVTILPAFTNVASGFAVEFTGQVFGQPSATFWDFGDGTVLSNRSFYASHSWNKQGAFLVVLRAFNSSSPAGLAATVTVHVVEHPVSYVTISNPNPDPPYNSWATAATNLQDAVNAAYTGGMVLASNGLYSPIIVNRPLTVQSLNGQAMTVINGGSGQVCASLASCAVLNGFMLTNGASSTSGGSFGGTLINCTLAFNFVAGAYSSTLSNCTLTNNSGDGAYLCTLTNCTLAQNSGNGAFSSALTRCEVKGSWYGANSSTLSDCLLSGNIFSAALSSTLNNCTVLSNIGTAAYSGTFNNCILYYNAHGNYSSHPDYRSLFNYCCTTPQPEGGVGNFTNAPLLMDLAGGNFRLQSNSPCINAGNNSFVVDSSDLDGRPRVVSGTVDLGAYEYQGPDNHPPLADASAIARTAVSANGSNAVVVLDGSRSSDPDGDPLQFLWYADGQTNASAAGILATNQFALGPHTVRLVVGDGHDTATAQASFEVITAARAFELLIAKVIAGGERTKPLEASLRAASKSLEKAHVGPAINQLGAFQHKVQAQVARHDPALAHQLIQVAQQIIEALEKE